MYSRKDVRRTDRFNKGFKVLLNCRGRRKSSQRVNDSPPLCRSGSFSNIIVMSQSEIAYQLSARTRERDSQAFSQSPESSIHSKDANRCAICLHPNTENNAYMLGSLSVEVCCKEIL